MINFLEALNTYDDTWSITFYFVAAIALMLGLLWTILQTHKEDKNKNNKYKENIIYNKSEDLIENMDIMPKRKKLKEELNNYYDVYQTENKMQESRASDLLSKDNQEEIDSNLYDDENNQNNENILNILKDNDITDNSNLVYKNNINFNKNKNINISTNKKTNNSNKKKSKRNNKKKR